MEKEERLKMCKIPEEVILEVEKIIEKEHQDVYKGLGYCHLYWTRKKKLLEERGYDWKSPAELNEHTFYD